MMTMMTPDTGTDVVIETPTPSPVPDVGNIEAPEPAPVKPPPGVGPPEIIKGPNPINAELLAARNTPEAMFWSRLSGPWTIVRRAVSQIEDDEAQAYLEGINEIIESIRAARREPENHSWGDITTRQKEMSAQLRAETWLTTEMEDMLSRVDGLLQEYEEGDATTAP
jgi:hypothetical protein